MNLDRLRVFRTIVEEGSFHRAAERLYLSQPSVSQNIAALEKEYDVRLFERKGRTIALTPEGRALHVLASDLLRKADAIPLRFREMQMLKYGKLAVTATPHAMNALVPEAFRLFREQFPHISLSLAAGNARDTLAALTNGAAELALLGKNLNDAPESRLTHRILGVDPVVIVSRDGTHELPLIRYSADCPLATFANALFLHSGPKSPDPLSVNDIEAARILALQGVGAALLPESRARDDLRAGRLKRVPTEGTPPFLWEIQAVYSTVGGLSYAGWEMVRILDRLATEIFAHDASGVRVENADRIGTEEALSSRGENKKTPADSFLPPEP